MSLEMADVAEEFLVTRRSRRSTAGNRMEAALAEMALDDSTKDAEDDNDFVNEKDEEDVFESDFESTDEEAVQGGVEVGEDQAVQDEEKKARKIARSRVEKATAAAHARHKVTFNPQSNTTSSTEPKPKLKLKRRVSLGVAVNAETGEVMDGGREAGKRQSQRKHTVLNTSATVKRMRRSEEKKAAATPKKLKTETRALTQDELIARALDNEEGNIVEHRDYLKLEEEKRKRARVVRATVDGPLLRWVSKVEEVKVKAAVEPTTSGSAGTASIQRPGYTYVYGTVPGYPTNATAPGPTPYGQTLYPYAPNMPYYHTPQANQPPGSYPATLSHPAASSTSPTVQSQPQSYPYAAYAQPQPSSQTLPPQPVEKTENVTRNYVIHELSQFEGVPKPQWNETMEAMFGDHVKWDELKVYVGKGRPLSRPRQICPMTGRLARYLDPRTNVPFADVRAYETLTKILGHEFVWSEGLGCYVAHQGEYETGPLRKKVRYEGSGDSQGDSNEGIGA